MFPDVSNRIPHQVRTSAVDVNPVTRVNEPSSMEEQQRAEAEIAAAAAAVRETDRMVLDAALKPEYTPSEQLATLALQTAAKSRSPLNVLKGVDAGRLVRVHERAMESLASTMEETAKDLFAPITALTPGLAGGSVTATVVPPPGAGERKDGHELNASREREARGNASGGWGAWLNFSV
jgi:23S rRNA pseudoU1915 N3-methylase RlmH|tara:strand:- start:116 stop:652 length:537 start_codon:yes stop_codon:yes gene_type:complete